MRITPFVCALSSANEDLHRMVEHLAHFLDSRQWTRAGIELGRIEQAGEHVRALARLARDAINEDEFVARRMAREEASHGDADA